jgi:hypothetical protein
MPYEKMSPGAKKMRDAYAIKPDAPVFQKEFGFYSLERWAEEGKLDGNPHDSWEFDQYLKDLFGYDDEGSFSLHGIGWTEAAFSPVFEEKILEDRGKYELVQDYAGRHVLYFKGRRSGFMPEYLDHPVKDIKSWEEKCKWRLDPKSEDRYRNLESEMETAVQKASQGMMITQRLIGGYMYLRSLMGPTDMMYLLYDDPDLINDCMKTWFELADSVIAAHQKYVTLDEIFLSEDICYNHGFLISPKLIRTYLFPYYQQLIANAKSRQLDRNRKLHIQVDTDGYAVQAISLYKEIGMDAMSPFEVASGCDVVKIGRDYPELILSGGIDKRVLAQGPEEIDRHLDAILPVMRKRGGYIPTCDHGVPAEVSFENYLYFRKRCLEYGK